MKSDNQWLERWKDIVAGKRVLELGCGDGKDTKILKDRASVLVSYDLNPALGLNDHATLLVVDHSKLLPFKPTVFEVVVASLTLHYFGWMETVRIINEISRVLVDDGILICRLNSREDINYGATGHPEIEPGLYNVRGQFKRFFDQREMGILFQRGWNINHLEHKEIDRYRSPKRIWELIARNK